AKPHRCEACGKAYARPSGPRRHRPARPLGCPHCPAVFFWTCHLSRHLRACRAAARPYACPECGKAFGQS
ncbi:ZNF99 protein, partial [Hemiprocne comata]|nr:ZNF99 protein [Hemiprocne comata]